MSIPRAIGWMLAAVLCAQAHAHTFLDHAEPRVGSVLRAAPVQLKLWFTQEIEPAFSSAKVLDAAGKRVDKADAQVDPAHRVLMRVSLQPLAPGDYRVVWRAVAVDTHVTEGDFAFHVRP